MTFKQPPGFISLSGKSGARLERKRLRQAFAQGNTAILNDLTNYLRYGDITLVDEDGPQLWEIKSGKHVTQRDRRQQTALAHLENYLKTGRTDELYDMKSDFRRIASAVEDDHHREQLNVLIADARRTGLAVAEVEEGLFYIINSGSTDEELDALLTLHAVKPRGQGRCFFVSLFLEGHTAHYPLPLSIWDPVALFEYYSELFGIVVLIDTVAIVEKFKSRGFDVESLFPDDEIAFVLRGTDPLTMKLGPMGMGMNIFTRVVTEFMSLDWLADTTASVMRTYAQRQE